MTVEAAVRDFDARRNHLLRHASDMTLRDLQEQQKPWVAHNFGHRSPEGWRPLMGAVEEMGELSHAHLKGDQGIRHSAGEILSMKIDAVADIIIYLADYCSVEGIDLQSAVQTTWDRVRQRDWKSDPVTGGQA